MSLNGNAYDAITQAISEAKAVNYACDKNATAMVRLVAGRLRHVSYPELKAIKRELRDFNIQTGRWK